MIPSVGDTLDAPAPPDDAFEKLLTVFVKPAGRLEISTLKLEEGKVACYPKPWQTMDGDLQHTTSTASL